MAILSPLVRVFTVVFLLFLAVLGIPISGSSQPFIQLEETKLASFPAIHSCAYVEHNGLWVFIGGRTNGLHDFRPPLAFPAFNANTKIWVIDPEKDESWSQSISELPPEIRDPLASSNLQWTKRDSTLYLVGGYGWESTQDTFITYPTLTAVNLSELVDAVKDGSELDGLFRQLEDERLAVCGAHMKRMADTFFLVFGHRFDGRYHRHEKAGFFKQEYTNQVRTFQVNDDGKTLSLEKYEAWTDTSHFHRRDYNLVPQMFNDKEFGFTAFSGVFRSDVNLPFYTMVSILGDKAFEDEPTFQQKYAHYHSAVIPVYDKQNERMHTFFMGGSAEYYLDDQSGKEVHDTMVPFVNTISVVSRNLANGQSTEKVLEVKMPGLLGTNAHFYPVGSGILYRDEILDAGSINGKTLVGYVVGGIESELDNVNHIDVSMTWASDRVFKVYMSNQPIVSVGEVESSFKLYPNPAKEVLTIAVSSDFWGADLRILDSAGREILSSTLNAEVVTLNIGSFSSGSYVAVVTKSGREEKRRFEIK